MFEHKPKPTGRIWEQDDGRWRDVNAERPSRPFGWRIKQDSDAHNTKDISDILRGVMG